jgi:hypothetical protein
MIALLFYALYHRSIFNQRLNLDIYRNLFIFSLKYFCFSFGKDNVKAEREWQENIK